LQTVDYPSPILLAPAGGREALSAALNNGANAVYFGVGRLNMRSHAAVNFTEEDLPWITQTCHARGAQAWLTVNIIAYDSELETLEALLHRAKDAGIDAIIAADLAVIELAHALGLPVHISVQANISNWRSVQFFSRYADVVVAARELHVDQLEQLHKNIVEHDVRGPSGELVRLEAFVHGALCIGLSGRCGMSLCEYNTSSNRGCCYQPCRREYIVRDDETGTEFKIDHQYIMSPKDLCTIAMLPRLLEAGVSVLKIEGRGRSADYVATTTACYRAALDMWLRHETPSEEQIAAWRTALLGVFNRRFWEGGYYLGEDAGVWAGTRDNQAIIKKEFLGVIIHYYQRPQIAEIRLQSGNLRAGQKILVTGPTTGAVEYTVPSIQHDGAPLEFAGIGSEVTFPIPTKLRVNDKVFALKDNTPQRISP
jgi:U32 family peptidase